MAEKDTANGPSAADPPEMAAEIRQFLAGLSEEQRMLIVLKQELYDGSWSAMRRDLQNRLDGKPYIFKLANRIQEDITRIDALEAFEKKHQVSLNDYIKPPDAP